MTAPDSNGNGWGADRAEGRRRFSPGIRNCFRRNVRNRFSLPAAFVLIGIALTVKVISKTRIWSKTLATPERQCFCFSSECPSGVTFTLFFLFCFIPFLFVSPAIRRRKSFSFLSRDSSGRGDRRKFEIRKQKP